MKESIAAKSHADFPMGPVRSIRWLKMLVSANCLQSIAEYSGAQKR